MASSSPPLNKAAQSGFSNSTSYNTHRPSYSSTATQLLLEHARIADRKNVRVLDLAAGTGKFTEVLAGRDEQYTITAVEPHAEMRRVLEGKGLNGVDVVKGSAVKIPSEDESFDAVLVAQVRRPSFYFTTLSTDETNLIKRLFIGSRHSTRSRRFIAFWFPMVFWE